MEKDALPKVDLDASEFHYSTGAGAAAAKKDSVPA